MKKKNKELIKLLTLIVFLLGVLAFVTIFFTAIKINDGDAYTGLQIAFGYEEGNVITVKILKFNFLVALSYILPVVGGVLGCLSFKGKGKLSCLVSSLLLVAGGVLLFFIPSFFVNGIVSDFLKQLVELGKDYITLSVFVYVGAILSIVGGVINLYKLTLVK